MMNKYLVVYEIHEEWGVSARRMLEVWAMNPHSAAVAADEAVVVKEYSESSYALVVGVVIPPDEDQD